MARRVQGEAKAPKASKLIPSTVMDMCEAQLKIEARKYVLLKDTDNHSMEHNQRLHTQRGVLRGVSTAYCMWYGSTPGQPKRDMIKETELRFVREARLREEEAA